MMIMSRFDIMVMSISMLSPAAFAQDDQLITDSVDALQREQIMLEEVPADQLERAVEATPIEVIEKSYVDHSGFDALLQKYVKPIEGSTAVDYSGFKADRAALNDYLLRLSKVEETIFDSWPIGHQLAFLINAYNAATIELILTHYPRLDSIRNIRSPWKQKFVSLFGRKLSLDNIEHDMIRGDRYKEPRIHFAVNCASIGCPALRANAYRGDILDQQLQNATQDFLSDDSRNYIDRDRLYLSNVFKWYRKDFEQQWRDTNSLAEFIILYEEAIKLNNEQKAALLAGEMKIKFASYDWSLNDTE